MIFNDTISVAKTYFICLCSHKYLTAYKTCVYVHVDIIKPMYVWACLSSANKYYIFLNCQITASYFLLYFSRMTKVFTLQQVEMFLCAGGVILHYAISLTLTLLLMVRFLSRKSLLTYYPYIIICYQCVVQSKSLVFNCTMLPTLNAILFYSTTSFTLCNFNMSLRTCNQFISPRIKIEVLVAVYLSYFHNEFGVSYRCLFNCYLNKLTCALLLGNKLYPIMLLFNNLSWIAS